MRSAPHGWGRHAACLILLVCAPLRGQVDLGILEIHSDPGTELHWEGTSLGTTNEDGILEVADIPPGDYSIQLTRKGFHPAAAQMQIRAGERTVLQLALQPKSVPAPSSDVPAETPAAEQKPASRPAVALKPVPLRVEEAAAPPEKEVEPALDVSAETSDADPDALRGPIPDTPIATDAPRPPYFLIAGLAAVALIAIVLYRRRNRPEPLAAEPPTPQGPTIQRIPRPDSSPEFLKDLKSRERDLDRFVPERRKRPRRPAETIEIIDVEVVEITEDKDVAEPTEPTEPTDADRTA